MYITWDQFKSQITDMIRGGRTFYFRGQRKPEWKLQTSFHRCAEYTATSLNDYFMRIIPEVMYHCSAVDGITINTWDSHQYSSFLARLQHHGFPTPLLDWSLSPYVAAYFAFKDLNPRAPDTDYVTVYIFDVGAWTTDYPQPLDFNNPLPFLTSYRPSAINNPRMSRQLAVTTATNIPDLKVYLTNQPKHYLYHFQISASERQVAMNDLNVMGINSMTMFPDFDGVCSAMREVFFNNVSVRPLMPVAPPPPMIPPPNKT